MTERCKSVEHFVAEWGDYVRGCNAYEAALMITERAPRSSRLWDAATNALMAMDEMETCCEEAGI